MRVYELARALGLPSSDFIARLRADGEWVASHLSVVPEPVSNRYLLERPTVARQQPMRLSRPKRLPRDLRPSLPPGDAGVIPRPRSKRRPGPHPVTMRRAARDDHGDPIDDLRYEPEISTRDVADLLRVSDGTVRRWVARGYMFPVGRLGPSNLYNTREVLSAHEDIKARRKATGQGRREDGYRVALRPIDRIRTKHYDAVVDIREAARLIEVSPATVRSWIHRGHLNPLPSSKPRAVRLRLGDVIEAARARRLPERSARPWRG